MLNERTGQVLLNCELSDHQVFARKIVRIIGDITPEDVESEERMLSDLCQP
jgi:hypothetical protein